MDQLAFKKKIVAYLHHAQLEFADDTAADAFIELFKYKSKLLHGPQLMDPSAVLNWNKFMELLPGMKDFIGETPTAAESFLNQSAGRRFTEH